ncbi:MAG TPA: VWA domain-containing protein [Sandaracinaceae bacterium LLY-WYZ-13_1]|nr:VWA domain-containing protein [Sandaracinaceae bacterium LLY-WYZ-13_1]
MGFEAPLALLALAAAGLPVLAHLLRRQDLPRRKLPTVALLRRAEASSKRRVRLVDLLLLIVRVLLVAMAALAIAGPFFRVALAYGDGSVASVAIVVDDSMSMGRGDPSLLARALERAEAIVESLPAGSEVAVVLAGDAPRVRVSRTDDRDAAARALEDVRGGARGTDLAGALERAERELAGARHADRRVVVLSDFAAHGAPSELGVPSGLSVRFEPVDQDPPTTNAAVVEARATPDPTTPGLASVAVQIAASPDLDGQRLEVVLRRGGEELARDAVELSSGGAHTTLHAPIDASDPGATVAIRTEDLDPADALPADDERGVLLRPPAGARVLLVDGDPHPVRGQDEARFLARAIDLAPADGGALSRRTVDPDTFAAMDLSEAEVIVLANVPALSRRVARRLREHVERGGGLWVTPGSHFDARAMEARLGALLPARPAPAVADEVSGPVPVPDGELFGAGVSGLESATTRRRIALERPDTDARVELAFGDGSPALVIGRRGDGRVALLATTVDDDWTDLPYRPGFLPMTVALLRELAPRTSTPDTALSPGTPVTLRPPAGAVRLRVVPPHGEPLELGPDALEDDVTVEDTAAAGVYRVQVATREQALHPEPRMAFLVAPPAEESDLSSGDIPEGAASEGGGTESAAVVERPIAPWLFLLVGLLAVTEAALRLRATHLGRSARPSSP